MSEESGQDGVGATRPGSAGPEGGGAPVGGGGGEGKVEEGDTGWKARATDPWAHRRGEPRLFAFLWSMYVLVAVIGSVLWLARLPVGPASTYSPAARTLLVVIAAGITVLWPMTRLSQVAPERNVVLATLGDLLVVQLPVQMVIWPMAFLASWPVGIVLAVSMLFVAWGLLTGGIPALGLAFAAPTSAAEVGGTRSGARWPWMAACVAAVAAGPLWAMVFSGPARAAPGWAEMGSPFTAIFALSGTGWTGPTVGVQWGQWTMVWVTGAVGVVMWLAAAVRAPAGRRAGGGLH